MSPREITGLEEFANAFRCGDELTVHGLHGRILRGRSEGDFETLTDDPARRAVIAIGADGLTQMLTATSTRAFDLIGYRTEHVRHLMNSGYKFRLVVFQKNGLLLRATWDNVAQIVSTAYPSVRDAMVKFLPALSLFPFDLWLEETNFDWVEVNKLGPYDWRYMTLERFERSRQWACDLRQFLYHTLSLKELFTGDGYTKTEKGVRGVKEYIMPNMKLADLGAHVVLPMDI